MYTYRHICLCIYMYTLNTYILKCEHILDDIYIYTYIYIYVCMYIFIYIYIFIHIYIMCIYISICTWWSTRYIYIYIHIYIIYIYIHLYLVNGSVQPWRKVRASVRTGRGRRSRGSLAGGGGGAACAVSEARSATRDPDIIQGGVGAQYNTRGGCQRGATCD